MQISPPGGADVLRPRAAPASPPHKVIRSEQSRGGVDWRELWSYRELLYFLVWRDVRVRYKQTLLGVAWVVLQPLAMMLLFTLVFGRIAGLDSQTGGTPYPVYVYTALLPWSFFANAVGSSGNSVVGNSSLITKVYFPRLIIPFAAVGAGLVDLAVSFGLLAGIMLWFGVALSWQWLWTPLLLGGIVLAATGAGTLLAALTVAYRDFRLLVPFLIQALFFLTPVVYPASAVPERWRWLVGINPVAGLVDGFRAALLGAPVPWSSVGLSCVISLLLFAGGVCYFRGVERRFADII